MKQKILKFGAAERQLREAVLMFFSRRDPIAVHTVVGAALQIFSDIGKVRGVRSMLGYNSPHVREDKWPVWNKAINAAKNFFKHGTKDPEGGLEFDPILNDFALFDAINLYDHLTQTPCKETQIFKIWFLVKHRNLFSGPLSDAAAKSCATGIPNDFEAVLVLIEKTKDGIRIPPFAPLKPLHT